MKRSKSKKFVYTDGKYEVTFEDGSVVECNELVSHGKKRANDGHYDHVLKFSDGVVQPFVGSSETVVIPDLSYL